MSKPESENTHGPPKTELGEQLERKTERKLKARRQGQVDVLFGLSTFGLVGWSIVMFTLLGIVLGWWLDQTWPGSISWTITLLFAGLALGCFNAWRWVKHESKTRNR